VHQLAKRIDTAEAKELVLQRVAAGMRVAKAMQSVGRAHETWRDWRKTDPEFKATAAAIRDRLDNGVKAPTAVPPFDEFSAKYLKATLPLHQLRALDVIEGNEPRNLHPSMSYRGGAEGNSQIILNFPPDHAKSTTWTVNWVTHQIHCDPGVRIIVISKTQRLAKQFLLSVKARLTNPLYTELHSAYAPEGGWRDEDLPWRDDMIYVRGRSPEEKDPTLQAIGIGGQIYGSRADIIICDDVEDLTNYGSYEQHAHWIAQEVVTRLDPERGRLVLVGTRVGGTDVYSHLRDEAKTLDELPTYTYFAQPAILDGETSPDVNDWQVLWPERMTPRVIRKKRSAFSNPRHFQLIYQQRDVSDNSVFRAESVRASVNGQRYPGVMYPGCTGHRSEGMQGLYVVAGWDPASSAGRNAMVVIGGDKATKKRWVLDAWNKKGALPRDSIEQLRYFTELYNVREWRIEKNAVQEFIVQLDEIRNYLAGRGCRLVPHSTTKNKYDANMGVETLAPLFDSCVDEIDGRLVPKPKGAGLIELPSTEKSSAVQELCNQLQLWEPEQKRLVQDLVMALWFAELGVRQHLLGGIGNRSHMPSKFTARGAIAKRSTISVEELHEQGMVHAL
jgi:hypothetical protein